jgi:hypothetical protein
MSGTVLWGLVILVSLISVVTDLLRVEAESNKGHLEIGRPPNASVALFPGIPFITIGYVATAWVLNSMLSSIGANLGFWAVICYGLVAIAIDVMAWWDAKQQIAALMSRVEN